MDGDGTEPASTDVAGTDGPVGSEPSANMDGSEAEACVASAEFVPLGVVPGQYYALWKVIDPRAGYAYWTHEYSGNDVRIEHYRWTAPGGIERVDELLQLPATNAESRMDVLSVSLDGRVILGSRWTNDYSVQEVFRYTPETGTAALDFYPRVVSRDGKVAIGVRDGHPLRWTENGGSTALALPSEMTAWNFDRAQFWSSESGDALLGVGVLAGAEVHVVRWTAASGSVDLGLLPAGVAGPAIVAITVSEAGDAVVWTQGNPAEGGSRVFRWTESSGSTELGVLAGLPSEASYMATHLSADGSVVVGSVQIPGQPASHVFRWTEALGMGDLMPGAGNVYPSQMSARGDVVIARDSDTVFQTNAHRWTEAGGVEALDLYVRAASADGSLLVGASGAQPAIRSFRAGTRVSPSLAELAAPTVVPADWSDAFIDAVSADGRLIAGTAVDPRGEHEAWLLRRTERCAAP